MPNRIRRASTVLAAACIVVLGPATQATAHPLSTTAVLLDVGEGDVTATIDLPLDQLGVAFDADLTATDVVQEPTLTDLRTYVQAHMSATDTSGQHWATEVTGGRVEQIDGTSSLVLDATLTPSSGTVGDFELHYDAVVEKLISHRVFVSARYGHVGAYTTLVMLSWQRHSVPVAAASASAVASTGQGFVSAVHLGVEHISGGSDHLLFLMMLLLPAPLVVRGRRWVRRPDIGRAGVRVVHVVTAFAVGHSITLALGALGWVHLPTRVVESGIALSVLVSAVHAVRPLVRGGEVVIAGSFGLLHGMAFAALLGELDLSRGGLVTTLLGFNIGIEITQLLVVALVMPSLILISRTGAYPAMRIGLAAVGAILAVAWLAERSGLTSNNPLDPVGEQLVEHPLPLAIELLVFALACTGVHRVRQTHRARTQAPRVGGVDGVGSQTERDTADEASRGRLSLATTGPRPAS
jgi:HupE / UreJ protein